MRIVAFLAWLLALSAQPAWAQQPSKLAAIEQRLAAMAAENAGEFGFAALDLDTGETISFNGEQPFPMASTMKVAVAAVYLADVDAGRRSLSDTIAGQSALSLMDAMITRSDNRATDLLLGALGGPGAIDGWMRNHKLAGIRVDRTIAQLLRDRRDLRDIRDSSTPAAMLQLLSLIDRGSALQPGSRDLLMDMMRRCKTGSNRMRALLPAGVKVEHKTGTLSGYTGDVGYLTLTGGKRIAVAFFARGGDNRPAVIATAARVIYDAFADQAKAVPAFTPAQVQPSTLVQPATGF